MATTRSQFIIKHYDGFGGNFLDSQYLGASYETGKPYVFENTLKKIFSSTSRFFTGKPLLGMTGAKPYGTKEIDTEIFRWKLQGAEDQSAIVVENVEAGNSVPGINLTTFKIKLNLDYFANPDVLMGEDNDFPLEIVDGPFVDGAGFVYTVRLQTDDPSIFFPSYLLEQGREFSKVWTSVASEYNERFGTQQYPNSFMLESQVGAFGQKVTVTDKALRDQGRIAVEFMYTNPRTNKEEKISKFLPMAEAKMHDELYMSMEAQMWFGKKSHKQGHKGYWIKTGPGLREQLRDGWVETYNSVLTTERLKNYLMSIFFSRVDEQNRKVVAMTGTLGALMFHDMLASESSSFLTVDTNWIQKLSENPRHLSYGAQFTHYQGPEGIEVTLMKNPMYDSRKYSKRNHPLYPEFPIDSMRFTFLDFGTTGGENNIQMLKVKDTYRWGYTVGTVGPMGPVKGGQAGALIAGYDMFTEGTGGIVMFDATRGGELIFDFEN
jgi:hypothetical protein